MANLEVSHGPIAEVDRVATICLNGPRIASDCTIKVPSLESFIGLGFVGFSFGGISPLMRPTCWHCTNQAMQAMRDCSSSDSTCASMGQAQDTLANQLSLQAKAMMLR